MKCSMEDRFWRKVQKTAGCWLWTGSKEPRGYGHFLDGRKIRKASHVSWEIYHGKPFPKGAHACHDCDNPSCVCPTHLYVGTNFTNQQDRVRRGRHNFASLTHCLRGHLLSPDNVYQYGNRRRCRVCLRMRGKKYLQKMNAKGYWKSGQSHGWRLRKG